MTLDFYFFICQHIKQTCSLHCTRKNPCFSSFSFSFCQLPPPTSSHWGCWISPYFPISITPPTLWGISLQSAGLFIFNLVQNSLPLSIPFSGRLIILFRQKISPFSKSISIHQQVLWKKSNSGHQLIKWKNRKGAFAWSAREMVGCVGDETKLLWLLYIFEKVYLWNVNKALKEMTVKKAISQNAFSKRTKYIIYFSERTKYLNSKEVRHKLMS